MKPKKVERYVLVSIVADPGSGYGYVLLDITNRLIELLNVARSDLSSKLNCRIEVARERFTERRGKEYHQKYNRFERYYGAVGRFKVSVFEATDPVGKLVEVRRYLQTLERIISATEDS